jgi:hypothetical protein
LRGRAAAGAAGAPPRPIPGANGAPGPPRRLVSAAAQGSRHVGVVELIRDEEVELVGRITIPIRRDDGPSTSQPSRQQPKQRVQQHTLLHGASRHNPKAKPRGSSWSKDADAMLQDRFVDGLLREALRHCPQQELRPQPLRLPNDMDKFAREKSKSKLLSFYKTLCERGQLSAALQLLHLAEKHGRHDMLAR